MSVFVVILDTEGGKAAAEVKSRLEQRFEFIHEYTPTCFLVADDVLTRDVAHVGGIRMGDLLDTETVTGAVFRVNGWDGYTDQSLWEWLALARQR